MKWSGRPVDLSGVPSGIRHLVLVGATSFLFLFNCSSLANAQDPGSPSTKQSEEGTTYPLGRGSNEFGVWTGFSPFSFRFEGQSEHRKLYLLNLQYARTLFATTPLTLKYTAEIVPVALEIQPTQGYLVEGVPIVNYSGTIYGAGASPIGFQANVGRKRVQPFANGSVGFLYFKQQVPVVGSSQFNFTVTIGFGAQFFQRSGRTFTVGWKYHHLSNDYTAPLNPGIDSSVFYAGFSLVRGGHR